MLNYISAPFRFSFHLFDGEGGGEGGGLGAEASAFAESIGLSEYVTHKQSDAKPDVKSIKYGKSSEGEDRTSQVGTDNQAPEDIGAEFAELIGKGGKYHDIYGQKVSEAVQQRFKNQADLQAQVDSISDALSPLYLNYGLKAGDIEGLKNAIANDEDIYKAGAEKSGLSLEQYKENLRLRADAERGRQITEAYERQQQQNEMFAQWESEAAELQQAVPNFDLGMEIQQNEKFARLLDAGIGVYDAFMATHVNDIMRGYNGEAYRSATQNVVNTIQQRAARPQESGLRHAPAIQRKSDPSSLTNEDMDEIIRQVTEEGASISF